MPQYILYGLIALIIIAIVWFIITKVLKNKTTSINTTKVINSEVTAILNALGGNENINEAFATNSKVTFKIVDDKLVNAAKLKELGASGVVISANKVSVIFGTKSKSIADVINQK